MVEININIKILIFESVFYMPPKKSKLLITKFAEIEIKINPQTLIKI